MIFLYFITGEKKKRKKLTYQDQKKNSFCANIYYTRNRRLSIELHSAKTNTYPLSSRKRQVIPNLIFRLLRETGASEAWKLALGAALGYPSTNSGIESTNVAMKREEEATIWPFPLPYDWNYGDVVEAAKPVIF